MTENTKPKRTNINRFSEEKIPRRITLMEKNALSSDWGAFSTIKVNYIYINRIWINTGNKLTSTEKYIILFGMVNAIKTFLTHRKCLNDFRVIPEKVKEDIKLNNPENFNKTLINVTAEQEGAKRVEEFRYIYCSICQKKDVPSLITKFQARLPDNPKIDDIVDNWTTGTVLKS